MDSRAKQRLTGAVILVALFVLLVPELLTGPRDAGGDAPSEEGMRRYTIDLDAPPGTASPVSSPEPAPAVALPPVAEHPPRTGESTRALPGEAAQPESAAVAPAPTTAAPMSAPPQSVASAVPPASTSEPAPTANRPTAGPKPVSASRPESAGAEAPRPASAAASPRGSFAVQLGSFVSRENAERLVREMNAKGFNAYLAPTIRSGGRDLYRVRVGPTRDRASAEALAAQLRRIGQQGSIVSIS